jgi:hypothetical protein
MRKTKKSHRRFPGSTPALVVAFVALFAAMGGFGYAAAKHSSVNTKNIKPGAVTTNKIADGAVTTPKLAPDAVAPHATNAENAARLGGAAPGQCQTGWLKASIVVDTSTVSDATPDAVVPGAFDCASKAADAVTIHRIGTGRYTLSIAGLDSGVAISSSANVGGGAANVVTAASKVAAAKTNLNVWNNGDAALVDGKTVSLLVF